MSLKFVFVLICFVCMLYTRHFVHIYIHLFLFKLNANLSIRLILVMGICSHTHSIWEKKNAKNARRFLIHDTNSSFHKQMHGIQKRTYILHQILTLMRLQIHFTQKWFKSKIQWFNCIIKILNSNFYSELFGLVSGELLVCSDSFKIWNFWNSRNVTEKLL